jgi:UDP-galactopyranose mutase
VLRGGTDPERQHVAVAATSPPLRLTARAARIVSIRCVVEVLGSKHAAGTAALRGLMATTVAPISRDAFDVLIVGAGLFGSTCAYELTRRGLKCLVLEKRRHIGGNCYTEQRDGIQLHCYGPHLFHTSDASIWRWVTQFTEFNDYRLRARVNFKGRLYSFPLNLNTFKQLWGVGTPEQARAQLERARVPGQDTSSLEGWALSQFGKEVYETFIEGYTKKQWGKSPRELPASVLKRLPVRLTDNENYFDDPYQGVPRAGYTAIFERLLDGVALRSNTDYLSNRVYFDGLARTVIYTGPIDDFFGRRFGRLEYRSLRLEHERLQLRDFQGFGMVNYTEASVPYTRVVEHKHFDWNDSEVTWITREYPTWRAQGLEAMYPIRDALNCRVLKEYETMARQPTFEKYHFGGRLAEYRYYDMHQVIAAARKAVNRIAAELGFGVPCAAI